MCVLNTMFKDESNALFSFLAQQDIQAKKIPPKRDRSERDIYCGISLQPQCLQTRASLLTSSAQSGHLTCVCGVGRIPFAPPRDDPNSPTWRLQTVQLAWPLLLSATMSQTIIHRPAVTIDSRRCSTCDVLGTSCMVDSPQFLHGRITLDAIYNPLVFVAFHTRRSSAGRAVAAMRCLRFRDSEPLRHRSRRRSQLLHSLWLQAGALQNVCSPLRIKAIYPQGLMLPSLARLGY